MTDKKFPAVTLKEVIRVLETIGFQFVRQSGSSHAIFKRKADNRRTNVPVHSGKALKRKTLKAILKDADLTVEEFNKFRKG